ncbi:putative hydrolase of the HAD superfamily [Desulfacinum hydrothermale DSM 13146]|uniref:Putative hydrolase of the HAD superfamily n=1 Tax=Desulfacinum hydrothermale DSM 13146 TaxID=1121390 RepID=A0A1W1XDS5_9BACT|nr:HAD family phosphatase [Desulfacinum hydrothermale]SMC21944.1 putative hydrolase of the HAD superfamily [Desulfacinum hydrothermale DSM 13146]
MQDLKAVVFDFGRVISAQKPPSLFRSYEEFLGIPPDTLNRVMFEHPAWEEALLGRITLDEYWERIGPALGLKTVEAVRAFRRRYDADERLNEEVAAIVRSLHGRLPLAVLSNAPRGLEKWLERWGLLHLFDAIFCSANEGVRKPFAEAYLRTLERLGVGAEETLFVDDAWENVAAARQLGLQVHHFRNADLLRKDLRKRGVLGKDIV